MPKTQAIPYVSATSFSSGAGGSGLYLRNILRVPIQLQRHIARGYVDASANGVWTNADLLDASAALVNMRTPQCQIIPQAGVRIGEAFDARTSALENRLVLPSLDRVECNVWNIPANTTYWVSMIGYRDEVIS